MHMKLLNTFKCIKIELIGGEPTLHPGLLDFCKDTCKYPNISILIYSNGFQNVEYIAKLLNYGVKVVLTLHYSICNDSLF